MCTTDAGPLQQLQSAMAGLTQVDPSAQSDQSVRTSLPALVTAFQQLSAVVCGVLGVFDGRDLAELDACATARTWLVSFARMTPNAASAWLRRARLLGDLPALRSAALSGGVTPEHLRWVLDLVQRVGPTAVAPFDEILATLATTLAPADLKVACERIAAHLDPDGPDPDPNGAFQRRELRLARVGAMMVLRGQLDPEAGAALLTALDAAMTPPRGDDLRTTGQRRADALTTIVNQVLGAGRLPTVHGVRPHLGILITPDTMLNHDPTDQPSAGHDDEVLRARIRHLLDTADDPTDPADHDRDDEGSPPADRDDPEAEPPDLGHRMTGSPPTLPPRPGSAAAAAWAALAAAGVPGLPEPARLDWFGDIPAAIAQRIACDCDVWRAVLDPTTGMPLEVGRTHRLV